jgi:hypothetical protein
MKTKVSVSYAMQSVVDIHINQSMIIEGGREVVERFDMI